MIAIHAHSMNRYEGKIKRGPRLHREDGKNNAAAVVAFLQLVSCCKA
jgi:hypothetical protein